MSVHKSPCFFLAISLALIYKFGVLCLQNGLAKTPPMGWLAWERFKCNTDCQRYPKNCISENLFMEMAEKLIEDGYKDVGYEYINIDDCWMAHSRDKNGSLIADQKRFPRGITFLANFMHKRGLKLGIYQDFGTHTCMGYPGIVGHMEQDAKTFSQWNVDMVKLDGCNSHPRDMDEGYVKFSRLLNRTGHPMVFSCSWPYYQLLMKMEPNYNVISSYCNLWRTFHDIQDSWASILKTIDFFGDNQGVLARFTGPGQWPDPDMIMIGNFHLTEGQARSQMAVWAMLPAPLLMSNDLRRIDLSSKKILLNKEVIAINQDMLGLPGKRIYKHKRIEIWTRKILPTAEKETSFAILYLNRGMKRVSVAVRLTELGINSRVGYWVQDVFREIDYGVMYPNSTLSVKISGMDVTMLNCKLET